jgi:uncharacterized membrane protein YfcA
MLPVVVWVVGVRASVPVLTIALIVGNVSRAWWSRDELDWRVIGAYLAGAAPLAAVGSVLYTATPPEWLSLSAAARPSQPLATVRLISADCQTSMLEVRRPPPGVAAATGPITMPFFLGTVSAGART